MIAIIDFGLGNLGAVRNMLRAVGAEASVTGDPAELAKATKIILPGVGAFDAGMRNLRDRGFVEPLEQAVRGRGVPVLGICLGMQLMALRSDEGSSAGLGWVDASVIKFDASTMHGLKVPHMGWNNVRQVKTSSLLNAASKDQRFYFVHSYFVRCNEPGDVLLEAEYGQSFHAAFERDNILGVQFHPEKSHSFGMRLLKNFVELY